MYLTMYFITWNKVGKDDKANPIFLRGSDAVSTTLPATCIVVAFGYSDFFQIDMEWLQ
jgi:hypothetical protein